MNGDSRCQPDNEHTPTPWAYRPARHDDWGWIRGPKEDDGIAPLVAIAKSGKWMPEEELDQHRINKTDPYGANALLIVEAVNSHASLKEQVAWWEGQFATLQARVEEQQKICDSYAEENQRFHDRIEELTKALEFYGDPRRYQGANLKPIPDDPYAKPDAAYIMDVTRDLGSIARRALAMPLEQSGSGK